MIASGDRDYGGDSSKVADRLTSGVRSLYATSRAFAALKADGSVIAWGKGPGWFGKGDCGGDCSKVQQQLVNVQSISSTKKAFAALKADGSIVTWGRAADQQAARQKATAQTN